MFEKRTTWTGLPATVAVAVLAVFFAAPGSVAQEAPGSVAREEGMPKANHYKCYQILDWGQWDQQGVQLEDQFGKSKAAAIRPYMLCNPVDKNGEGIADKENHLVCYQIQDDPTGEFERVREVEVQNQFGRTTLWVGVPGETLCLPSKKQLVQ